MKEKLRKETAMSQSHTVIAKEIIVSSELENQMVATEMRELRSSGHQAKAGLTEPAWKTLESCRGVRDYCTQRVMQGQSGGKKTYILCSSFLGEPRLRGFL